MKSRVLFLADINSPHTQKWAISLAEKNFEIGIFSFNHSDLKWMASTKNIVCLRQAKEKQLNNPFSKLKYLLLLLRLFIVILKFRPHIMHVHYASSYGLLGALTFYKPLIISAWGSDLTEFPDKSWLHKYIIKFVLWRADKICVSSTLLQREVKKYSKKPSVIIPFGIDFTSFYKPKNSSLPHTFTFGCVKPLEKHYNIDKVVVTFSLLIKHYPKSNLRLKLVGDGMMRDRIFLRAKQLRLLSLIEFTGWVEHQFV
ncbi:MAG: glycosyltransferase, partial [Bacteroidia bacterium]|nr:glycosyltransferase [Bacteroidia bacterium]